MARYAEGTTVAEHTAPAIERAYATGQVLDLLPRAITAD